MIVVGLTGSIGMGKTTVAAMFRRLGLPVNNADSEVHRLLMPKGRAFAAVSTLFPAAVKNGIIDRMTLGGIVFADSGKLAALEAILHPLVAQQRAAFVAAARRRGARIVVLDIPLLFERSLDPTVDIVITVSAPAFVQRARVMMRPGMTEDKFRAMLSRQMPDAEKRRRSDYVIATGQARGVTLRHLQAVVKELDSQADRPRKRHARNRSRY